VAQTISDSAIQEGYFPIYQASLVRDSVISFDVFVRFGHRCVLFRSKDLVYTGEGPPDLESDLQDILFVKVAERREYLEYLERNLKSIVEDPEVAEDVKATVLVETSKNVVTSLFENPDMGQNIGRASTVVGRTVDFVLHGREAIQNLLSLSSHDYHTYSHSVNVSVYAIALAWCLSRRDEALRDIGLGAILHDVGKVRIDDRIINKEGPLNDEEFEEMKKHPVYSYKILREQGVPESIGRPGFEHHERVEGGGYPRGIRGDQMHPYSKICAIADAFDALTTNRSYRKSFPSFEALKMMKNEMRGSFEPTLLHEMIQLMGGV